MLRTRGRDEHAHAHIKSVYKPHLKPCDWFPVLYYDYVTVFERNLLVIIAVTFGYGGWLSRMFVATLHIQEIDKTSNMDTRLFQGGLKVTSFISIYLLNICWCRLLSCKSADILLTLNNRQQLFTNPD